MSVPYKNRPPPPATYHVRINVYATYDYYVLAPQQEHAEVVAAYHAQLDAQNGKNLAFISTVLDVTQTVIPTLEPHHATSLLPAVSDTVDHPRRSKTRRSG